MIMVIRKAESAELSQRIREIQKSWTSAQRFQRTVEGHRRSRRFARLIGLLDAEPEIWAGGAISTADFERLQADHSLEPPVSRPNQSRITNAMKTEPKHVKPLRNIRMKVFKY